MPSKRKTAWERAVEAGADPEAPFGYKADGTVRKRAPPNAETMAKLEAGRATAKERAAKRREIKAEVRARLAEHPADVDPADLEAVCQSAFELAGCQSLRKVKGESRRKAPVNDIVGVPTGKPEATTVGAPSSELADLSERTEPARERSLSSCSTGSTGSTLELDLDNLCKTLGDKLIMDLQPKLIETIKTSTSRRKKSEADEPVPSTSQSSTATNAVARPKPQKRFVLTGSAFPF